MWIKIPGKRKGKAHFRMSIAINTEMLDKICAAPSAVASRQISSDEYEVLFQSADWRFLLGMYEHLSRTYPNAIKDVQMEYCGPNAGVVF